MIIGETVSLARNRLSDIGAAIADVNAIEASESVDELDAMRILDADALASLYDRRLTKLAGSEILELGEWMQDAASVLFANFPDIDRHWAHPLKPQDFQRTCILVPDTRRDRAWSLPGQGRTASTRRTGWAPQ